ncbi:TetR/AcrR family transcriptional regulator [Streptomyces caatingaensis]|uniref:TetR family transcriptional regulator n=1 Tax=Streptomyces caatingaensis TaxID=1678637 RepID=A0A0K9XB68_9ACTN|nr:TetR/AcrR family transcriptional regulator [Streptomyces caatingaensis]KNB50341.1 TetR family transcriptional regulator [Streptomyces caatingaensis]
MPREVRERQMLDAAVRVFARRGYGAASMDEIAELAGASKPLVYLYLNSKEDLFTACVRREADVLLAAVRAAVRPEDPAERRLWNGLRAFFAHTAEHPEGWAVLSRQARSYGEPFAGLVAELREGVVDIIVRLIEEAAGTESLDGCEASGLAYALVGAAESLADRATCPEADAPAARDAAATLMNVAWVGLENLVNGRRWGVVRA